MMPLLIHNIPKNNKCTIWNVKTLINTLYGFSSLTVLSYSRMLKYKLLLY